MLLSFTSLGLMLAYAVLSAATIIDVTVGGVNGELVFSPEAIFAQPGDQVVYSFNPKNHTVTQSSFANPCGFKPGGIDSGFQPVMINQTNSKPTYTVLVNDTQPIWIYCRQGANTANSHCGQGMVHAINCGANGSANSFANFKASALAIGASLSSAAAASTPPSMSTTSSSSMSTSLSNSGNVITVIVGGSAGNVFTPSRISAVPGNTVVFQFQQKNHTVTQSSFAAPCVRLNNATSGQVGFDSGFFPVAVGSNSFPTWNLTINDTAPIWAYCAQNGHCGQGMVFAINSVESGPNNFAAFQGRAKQLNGSSTASAAGGSVTGTTSGGRSSYRVEGSFVVAGFAALVGLIL